MNIKREVELLKSMGFNVTEASLQAEKDMHAARVAEDLKHRAENEREAVEIGEVLQWVGQDLTPNPKYHVSKEWAKRHLTLDPSDLDKAFGVGNWVLS